MNISEPGASSDIFYLQREADVSSDVCFIFLHGFASDAAEWEDILEAVSQKHSCIALSLPGCFESGYPENFTPHPDALGEIVEKLLNRIPQKKKILCGYSMGARLALYTAIYKSPSVSGLILESGTPGMQNPEEKKKRIEEDNAFADLIAPLGGDDFEAIWKKREIFSSQAELPPGVAERLKQRRQRANPAVMAEYLRHFGTGVMPDMRNDLGRISVPVMIITGEKDEKFSRIGSEMHGLISGSRHQIIPGAGHNTHLEKPADFVNLLFNFSENL